MVAGSFGHVGFVLFKREDQVSECVMSRQSSLSCRAERWAVLVQVECLYTKYGEEALNTTHCMASLSVFVYCALR